MMIMLMIVTMAGASSMLTRRDFRGYKLNEKGDITRGGILLMRAYDLLYCAPAKYLILRYESGIVFMALSLLYYAI